METEEKRNLLVKIIRLEKEQADLETEISSQQKALNKLSFELEFAQDEFEKLENSKAKRFLLGLTGKLETSLQDTQSEIRKLQGAISNAKIIISNAEHRIENIEIELQSTMEYDGEFVSILSESENGNYLIQSFSVVRNLPILNKEAKRRVVKSHRDIYLWRHLL